MVSDVGASVLMGRRIGAYQIQTLLGAGGMGEVYRARDTRLDRAVAIKVLPQALAHDSQFRERFDREARAISRLTHPHICTRGASLRIRKRWSRSPGRSSTAVR